MTEVLVAAFALMLVLEGVLPFAAPKVWREAFKRFTEMSDRVGSGLAGTNGQQSLQDIQAELAFAQTTMKDAGERQSERKMMLEDLLQGIEQAPQEEVAAQILALQTRLQASLQTTAMLYQLNITQYL